MNIKRMKTITALPLVWLSARVDEGADADTDASAIDSEHMQLRSIEITGDGPDLLQPLQVRVSADVSAQAYETNINVGLRSIDGA